MLHAYRLVYPISEHAPPQIWEYEQPYIDNLLQNARTFDRFVTQWYFKDWVALDRDNTRIWNSYYRPKPLFDHLSTWQDWLPEYRQLIIEVQEMVDEHKAQGRGKDLGVVVREAVRSCANVLDRIALRFPRSCLSESHAFWSL